MIRRAIAIGIAFVVMLACGLAVLGGIGSFESVRHLAAPWFGQQAWIVPVGIDVGILALLAWDLLAEHLGLPWPPLRWTAWAFIVATVYLNIAVAHRNLNASVMHAAMPILLITVIEGSRHLIRQATGLANGTRIERVPVARWILAPRSSFLLFRHMVLWHVTAYRHGLALEHQRLMTIARLQQEYGHFLWRWRAPLGDRLALRLESIPAFASRAVGPETRPTLGRLTDKNRRLVEAAVVIIQDARDKGVAVSQATLGRALRKQGLPIANDRLRWLVATADAYAQERGT